MSWRAEAFCSACRIWVDVGGANGINCPECGTSKHLCETDHEPATETAGEDNYP